MRSSISKAKEVAETTQGREAAPSGVPAVGDLRESVNPVSVSAKPISATMDPHIAVAIAAAPGAVGIAAPMNVGSQKPAETLDERDARRLEDLARQMKMVRARRHNRQVANQKILLKKSMSEMTSYLAQLPAGAQFTIEVLVRLGAKAEELGLDPADIFAKLGEIAQLKQKRDLGKAAQ